MVFPWFSYGFPKVNHQPDDIGIHVTQIPPDFRPAVGVANWDDLRVALQDEKVEQRMLHSSGDGGKKQDVAIAKNYLVVRNSIPYYSILYTL